MLKHPVRVAKINKLLFKHLVDELPDLDDNEEEDANESTVSVWDRPKWNDEEISWG